MRLWQWRWKSIGISFVLAALVFYSLGWIPGVDGPFAFAKTVQEQTQQFQKKIDDTNGKLDRVQNQLNTAMAQLKEGQVRQLNSDLIDARRYQCRGINSDDKAALPFWNSRLQDLKVAYFSLTGSVWPDLACNSF